MGVLSITLAPLMGRSKLTEGAWLPNTLRVTGPSPSVTVPSTGGEPATSRRTEASSVVKASLASTTLTSRMRSTAAP